MSKEEKFEQELIKLFKKHRIGAFCVYETENGAEVCAGNITEEGIFEIMEILLAQYKKKQYKKNIETFEH